MAKKKKSRINKDGLDPQLIKDIENLEAIKSTDSAKVISEKLEKQASVIQRLYTTDAFMNKMARTGFGQPNLAEGAEYPMTRLTKNYQLFNSMYRGSWIVRKIVDIFPADMLKNWITISSSIEPEALAKIDKTIRYTKTKEKLKQGLQWGRLYGGAAALILIDGQEDQLDQPLDYDTIVPDSYKGLLVFDRWSGITPDSELITDISDPDFGLPKYYTINTSNVQTNSFIQERNNFKVHHSRILRFAGRELPYWEKIQEMYWGESEVEIAYEEIKKRDNTSANLATMIFLANIRVLKMNDLGQLLGSASKQAQENLYNVLSAQDHLMSNMGIYVMDKEDDFAIHNYSFGGLDELYQSFMLDIAGACEMPVTKLFGREPSGWNSTGENDLVQYYDTVAEKQEAYLLPVIDKLLPIICMSSLGAVPDNLEWEFNPIRQVSAKDRADLASSLISPILEVFNAGLITKEIALKELKAQSEATGMWTSIDDEYIKKIGLEESANEEVYSDEDKKILENQMEGEGDNKDTNEGNERPSEGPSGSQEQASDSDDYEVIDSIYELLSKK